MFLRRFFRTLLPLLGATVGLVMLSSAQDISPRASVIPLYTNDGSRIFCSAFVIDTDRRYLMTADHCIVEVAQPMVLGKLAWEVFHVPDLDISVLQADAVYRIPALKASVTAPVMAQMMTGYGFAGGKKKMTETTAEVIFPGINFTEADGRFILYTPSVTPGMSGGPLLTNGRVVGVMQMTHRKFPLSLSRSIVDLYAATKSYWGPQ